MKTKIFTVLIVSFLSLIVLGAGRAYFGATNFDRLVLGTGNFGTDPNPTADLTFQNDEFVKNSTDGTLDFGAAILATTGALDGGAQIVGIDSFLTTATADTILLTGVVVGDIFSFSEYTPAYSTAIDTVTYSYVTQAGKVIVTRTGPAAGTAYKSGGLYSYIRVK